MSTFTTSIKLKFDYKQLLCVDTHTIIASFNAQIKIEKSSKRKHKIRCTINHSIQEKDNFQFRLFTIYFIILRKKDKINRIPKHVMFETFDFQSHFIRGKLPLYQNEALAKCLSVKV